MDFYIHVRSGLFRTVTVERC